jgi:hypothetical protein
MRKTLLVTLVIALGVTAAHAQTYDGSLDPGDEQLKQGEYYDSYPVHVDAGQWIEVDMTSDDFDTYLILIAPSGAAEHNDDFEGSLQRSNLRVRATETGIWNAIATSYSAREVGRYRLEISLSGRATAEFAGKPGVAAAPRGAPGPRRIDIGGQVEGRLQRGDDKLESGEFAHTYVFEGRGGEPVLVEMTSDELDPYLILITPGGTQLDNDDWEGSITVSRIELIMPEDGTYRVRATSYAPGETGSYRLRVTQQGAMEGEPLAYDRIVGLFVGISDYGGTASDLRYTADDATRIHDALVQGAGMRPSDAIILTDGDATRARFRQAVAELAARASERTLFVLFFSGHGGQIERDEWQPTDPDGKDETLLLRDGDITDDELTALLAPIRSAQQLIVLDACFSGGFTKDLISVRGRMGLFSSEEDVVSSVAAEFEAGGYLARFFADALTTGDADEDRNGMITALELSTYLRKRYNEEIQDEQGLVLARATRRGHQVLVVDRGSIGPFTSLFALPRARARR